MNGRFKTLKYLDKTLPNTQIPYIGDYVRIISALCNKFRQAISTGNVDEDIRVACKMKVLRQASNILQQRVICEKVSKIEVFLPKMKVLLLTNCEIIEFVDVSANVMSNHKAFTVE